MVDHEKVVAAIRAAEARRRPGPLENCGSTSLTSGSMTPIVRRSHRSKPSQNDGTRERNGVLIFIAPGIQKCAVVGADDSRPL